MRTGASRRGGPGSRAAMRAVGGRRGSVRAEPYRFVSFSDKHGRRACGSLHAP